MFLRFPLRYRIEHWVLATVFTILALTGLVQFFSSSEIAQSIVDSLGGIERTRSIHHFCAILMIIETLVHMGVLQYRAFLLMKPSTISPGLADLKNAIQAFAYNLGFSKERPKEGRYTFAEKAEYWAVVWGTVIMAITGFMMWNPVATTRVFPGEIIPAAKVAHGLEAILAVLAIIVWHFYFTLIKTFNMSMFTGYITIEQMKHEHPLEFADEMRGFVKVPDLDPVNISRFWKFLFPQYMLICILIMSWVFYFVFFEQTSIEMVIPPENVTAFLPERELQAIERGRFGLENSTYEKSWNSGISNIFERNCVQCHGDDTTTGLNLSNYQLAMASGDIIPHEPYDSPLLIKMERDIHYGMLSNEELAYVHIWISIGAPLNPEEAEAGPQTEESVVSEEPAVSESTAETEDIETMVGLDETPESDQTELGVDIEQTDIGDEPVVEEEPEAVEEQVTMVEPDVEEEAAPVEEQEIVEETPSETAVTWNSTIGSILNSKCGSCHGAVAMGGLNVTDYTSIMASGSISSGDSGSSVLVQKMEEGGHPGSLTSEELELLKNWIESGAPQGD